MHFPDPQTLNAVAALIASVASLIVALRRNSRERERRSRSERAKP